jgi:prepilin peptidase CpaA
LACAAWTDIATRSIPDLVSAVIGSLGLLHRLMAGPSALLTSALAALGIFTALFLLHARGVLGGGDVKLAAAVCLGLSPLLVYRFVFITAMAGGVLALLHIIARRCLRNRPPRPPPPRGAWLPKRVFYAERWRIARRGSLSYGVAIACGGIWTVLSAGGI